MSICNVNFINNLVGMIMCLTMAFKVKYYSFIFQCNKCIFLFDKK